MLPAPHRLTTPDQFRTVVRRGRRRGSSTLVVHLLTGSGDAAAPRAGFVVSKAVGSAVVRNRVKRRLRHLVVPHLATLPDGAMLVVRALPPAAEADSAQLGRDLARGLEALSERRPAEVGA